MGKSHHELVEQASSAVSAMDDVKLRQVAFDKVLGDLLPPSAEHEYETYKLLLDLWKSENPIKTSKLQVLLAVNALLVSGLKVSGTVIAQENWPVYGAGAVFSIIWMLSIGRTSLFQEIWQIKLRRLQASHNDDPRFRILDSSGEKGNAPALLRWFGAVPSRWYLLFSPLGFAVAWLVLLAASRCP